MEKIKAFVLLVLVLFALRCNVGKKEVLTSKASQNNGEAASNESKKGKTAAFNKHGFYIPQNIDECMLEVDKSLTEKSKNIIKSLKKKELRKINDLRILSEWDMDDTSRVTSIFRELGLFETRLYHGIIIKCYYRYLHHSPLNFEKEVSGFVKQIETLNAAKKKEYDRIMSIEKIDGVYIPKDINDCFNCLGKALDKETILKIKSKPDSAMSEFHFSLGLWIRNNWKLWGGSRLQLYFMDMGVRHPDDMSAIILCSFNRHLKGIPIDIAGQIKKQQQWYQNSLMHHPVVKRDATYNEEDYYDDGYKKFLKERKQDIELSDNNEPNNYFDY